MGKHSKSFVHLLCTVYIRNNYTPSTLEGKLLENKNDFNTLSINDVARNKME